MFNNPYFNGFREQQPITQNFQLTSPFQENNIFIARYVKDNENIDNILITNKTAFIDLQNNKLIIKDMDLTKKVYNIIPPKDEKDLKIEMLEKELNELKGMITNEPNANDTANNESTRQNGNAKKSSK